MQKLGHFVVVVVVAVVEVFAELVAGLVDRHQLEEKVPVLLVADIFPQEYPSNINIYTVYCFYKNLCTKVIPGQLYIKNGNVTNKVT